jgi:hypothetical protein
LTVDSSQTTLCDHKPLIRIYTTVYIDDSDYLRYSLIFMEGWRHVFRERTILIAKRRTNLHSATSFSTQNGQFESHITTHFHRKSHQSSLVTTSFT